MRPRLYGSALDEYLSLITDALVQALSPHRIILFGSFARGVQNRASDLDLVVITPTALPFEERIGQALKACYAASTRLPVEALVYTPDEWERMCRANNSFAALIAREGRVLYDREQPHRRPTLAETGAA
jgi:predicted nucleotidyltransferase